MAHTQGPWKVLDGAIVSEKLTVFGNWIIAGLDRPRTDEDEDNLTLIAAAPMLLEACKSVLDIINAYSHIPAQFKACEILQAAIAQAEGRE